MKPSTLLLPALGAILSGISPAAAADGSDCPTGLYMIVARGSGEPAGAGRMATVAGNVTERIPGSKVTPLVYPAEFQGYSASEAAGVAALGLAIAEFVKACPRGKFALLGWSQGAQVSLDTLCGTDDGGLFKKTEAIGVEEVENLVAVVGYGDPTHVPGLPWSLGTSKNKGIFPRQNTAACEPFADRIRTYCDTGDIYCDGGNVTAVHSSYFNRYTGDAADFIVAQFEAAGNDTTGGSGGGNSSSSGGGGGSSATTTGTGVSSPTASTTTTGSQSGSPSASSTTTTTGTNAGVRLGGSVFGYLLMGVVGFMVYV